MTLDELEQHVSNLPAAELAKFREWFLDFDGKHWSTQIENDAASGRLDSLADEAIRQHKSGESSPL